MAVMTREGQKGGHWPTATLSQVVEMRKRGSGDEKTKWRRNPRGGQDSGGQWSGCGSMAMGRGQWWWRQQRPEEEGRWERKWKSCTSGNAGEVRSQSGWRRMTTGRGRWSEMKAQVGHNNNGSGQKKRAVGIGRLALLEHRGSQAAVREEDGDGSGKVVGDEGFGRP